MTNLSSHVPTTTKTQQAEFHKKTATHLNEAAKHHLEAAKHYETGDHEKAAESTVKAQGHTVLAHENQKEHAKQHALKQG